MHIFSLTGYNHFDGWIDVSFIIVILSIQDDAIQSGPRMDTDGTDLHPTRSMEPSSVDRVGRRAMQASLFQPSQTSVSLRRFLSVSLSRNAYGQKSWSIGVFCHTASSQQQLASIQGINKTKGKILHNLHDKIISPLRISVYLVYHVLHQILSILNSNFRCNNS